MSKGQGRHKGPTALAEAKGKVPFKPARNRDEPRPDRGLPPAPDWLPIDKADEDDKVRADWCYYCTILDKVGILTVADGAILGALCAALWEIRGCLSTMGPHPDRNSPETKRLSTMLNLSTLRMIRLAASLGLEPSSRAGLYTGEGAGKERSAMEKFQADGEKRQAGLRIVGA